MSELAKFYYGKHVAVLGGNGMLGSYIVDRLCEIGAVPIIYDLTHCPWRETPKGCIELVPSDCSHFFLTDAGNADLVINCAAKVTGITWNEHHHADMALANAPLAISPLKSCIQAKTARYVYISTACVYPAEAEVPTDEHWGWKGSPEPTNYGYGLAKRFGEQLCMLAKDEHPWFKPLVLRPSNMYSPRENFDDPNAHVIPRTVSRVVAGENPIIMRGSGNALRSFLHAKDAAECVLLLAMTDYSGILNLPAPASSETSIFNLASAICDVSDSGAVVRFSGQGDDGYQRRLSSDAELQRVLAENGLKWAPKIPMHQGLKDTIQAFRNEFARKSLGTLS